MPPDHPRRLHEVFKNNKWPLLRCEWIVEGGWSGSSVFVLAIEVASHYPEDRACVPIQWLPSLPHSVHTKFDGGHLSLSNALQPSGCIPPVFKKEAIASYPQQSLLVSHHDAAQVAMWPLSPLCIADTVRGSGGHGHEPATDYSYPQTPHRWQVG